MTSCHTYWIVTCLSCVFCHRIRLARRGIGPSQRPTTAAPWASSSCMTSPTRSPSLAFRTGEIKLASFRLSLFWPVTVSAECLLKLTQSESLLWLMLSLALFAEVSKCLIREKDTERMGFERSSHDFSVLPRELCVAWKYWRMLSRFLQHSEPLFLYLYAMLLWLPHSKWRCFSLVIVNNSRGDWFDQMFSIFSLKKRIGLMKHTCTNWVNLVCQCFSVFQWVNDIPFSGQPKSRHTRGTMPKWFWWRISVTWRMREWCL